MSSRPDQRENKKLQINGQISPWKKWLALNYEHKAPSLIFFRQNVSMMEKNI